ncbi:hypothetical protein ACF0H5_022187 [Mactra antiquata]
MAVPVYIRKKEVSCSGLESSTGVCFINITGCKGGHVLIPPFTTFSAADLCQFYQHGLNSLVLVKAASCRESFNTVLQSKIQTSCSCEFTTQLSKSSPAAIFKTYLTKLQPHRTSLKVTTRI